MHRSFVGSLLVALCASSVALAQPKQPAAPKPARPIAQPAAVRLELSGAVKLRPQETDRALSAAGKNILFADESLLVDAVARFEEMADRSSFTADFPVLVLQRREGAAGAWTDVQTFYAAGAKKPPGFQGISGKPGTAAPSQPTTKVEPELPRLEQAPGVTPTSPELPREPGQKPKPKVGPPFDAPATTVPGLSFRSTSFSLPAGTSAIRASARRADGSSLDSPPLQLEVRGAPAILTVMAQGGACIDADGNLDSSASVTRNDAGCAAKNLNGVFLADLTPKASINCNDHCNASCTNFFEHLAAEIMDKGLANHVDFINNPGTQLCAPRDVQSGLRNRIVVGKWRNTEEENVPGCQTPLQFNDILDTFENQGGRSVILIGQSLGGAKLTKMQRDNWRWDDLTLELLVLWDATSLGEDGSVTLNGHSSNGVRTVGSRAKRVLSFYQYDNGVAFQNGAPLSDRSDAEQHDYNECLTHNGIARGQFIHHRTAEAVKTAVQAARDRARQ